MHRNDDDDNLLRIAQHVMCTVKNLKCQKYFYFLIATFDAHLCKIHKTFFFLSVKCVAGSDTIQWHDVCKCIGTERWNDTRLLFSVSLKHLNNNNNSNRSIGAAGILYASTLLTDDKHKRRYCSFCCLYIIFFSHLNRMFVWNVPFDDIRWIQHVS